MVPEKQCVLVVLLHGDHCVEEYHVGMVSLCLSCAGLTLCSQSCPVQQVQAMQHGEGVGISQLH